MGAENAPQSYNIRKIIEVPLATQPYRVYVGAHTLGNFPQWLRAVAPEITRVLIVADHNTGSPFGIALRDALNQSGIRAGLQLIGQGEAAKSLDTVRDVWLALSLAGAARDSAAIALGGGVVGDVTGFAAATYMRGIPLIQVPTTLLAQVDSAIGGKTGINFRIEDEGLLIKNLLGAFHQPRAVLADVALLQTLPDRHYRSGLAEVIKYGAIMDEAFFDHVAETLPEILERNQDLLIEIVAHCCALKARVVSADERETSGYRSILNFGHTYGHAIESLDMTGITHGEAVAKGMVAAAKTAELLALCDPSVVERIIDVVRRAGFDPRFPDLDLHAVLSAMERDKKVRGGQLTLVLPTRLGEVRLVRDVSSSALREAMVWCQSL